MSGTSGGSRIYDAVVVGGGPAGATAAAELAAAGRSVVLLDREGRIKPCGGAVPPQLLRDFDVPETLLVNRIDTARILSPRGRAVWRAPTTRIRTAARTASPFLPAPSRSSVAPSWVRKTRCRTPRTT